MTAPARLTLAGSLVCARCDGPMVVTYDAIGRERRRCPKCDGVSKIRPHPDEVLIPQGLVPVPTVTPLPAIDRDQLRCQRCARGVSIAERFCPSCLPFGVDRLAFAPKLCARCGSVFLPTGPNGRFCDGCR